MVSRLTKKMVEVLQQDLTSTRGQRNIIDGEAELLQGFEFNANAKLSTTMYAPFTSTVDRVAGTLAVNIPAFVPGNMIAGPGGCTHYKLISAAAEIDFENDSFVIDSADTLVLPWDFTETAVIDLPNIVTPNSTHPLFLAFGIEFFQDVNGIKYPLKNGAYNALALVKVSGL